MDLSLERCTREHDSNRSSGGKPLIHPISIHKFHQYDRYRTTKSTHQTAFQPTIRQAPSYGDLRPVGIRILPQRTPHQRNYRIIASSGENRQQKVRFMITFATFFERRLSLYQGYSKGIRSAGENSAENRRALDQMARGKKTRMHSG